MNGEGDQGHKGAAWGAHHLWVNGDGDQGHKEAAWGAHHLWVNGDGDQGHKGAAWGAPPTLHHSVQRRIIHKHGLTVLHT